MLADVTRDALQLKGHLHDFLSIFITLDKFSQLRLIFEGLFERHARHEWNQLRKLISQRIGFTLHAGDIAHHRLRGHSAKCNYLRDRVFAIEICNVLNNAVPTFHAEIHVKVRHRDPLWIEETLKQQVVAQWIKVGNTQGIGDDRTSS